MTDKWLEALQTLEKTAVNPAPQPVPQPESAGDPFLDAVLSRVLYDVEDEKSSGVVSKTAVFMDDVHDRNIVDPVGALIEKGQQDRVLNARSSPRVWRGLPEGELVIETDLAKIIGAREEDMAPLEK